MSHPTFGVGSHIVADAVRRASDMGYLAIFVQTELNNNPAHGLYSRHGFIPARQGEMLRMIRFLNYPALSLMRARHPLALFDSTPAGDERLWQLNWRDAINGDQAAVTLSGGSCQGDSDGFGPGAEGLLLESGGVRFAAGIAGPSAVRKEEVFEMEVSVTNSGSEKLKGWCRLLLNPGFAPAQDSPGVAEIQIEPSAPTKLRLPVTVLDSFDADFWKHSAYPSVPISIEFLVGEYSFWLVRQVQLSEHVL